MMIQLIDIVYFIIFGVMTFSTVMWLLIYLLNRDSIMSDPEPESYPKVSFIVPAYNEETHISDSLDSLLNQDYPSEKIDIIAVNDGSEDNTLEAMREYGDKITIINKENGGKAAAMNTALKEVETELVGCLDADSVASKSMISNMVGYFKDKSVKGVTPAMKVKNDDTWMQKMMWTEYVYQIFLRKLLSIFDSQWVMPGPGSIYRTDTVKEVGGWDEETLTEDMEVTFRMHEEGAVIKNSVNAEVLTHSPETMKGLLNQRVRWYSGYIENFLDFKHFTFNPSYGNLGMVMLPFNLLFTAIIIFFSLHAGFRMLSMVWSEIQVMMLVGYMTPSFGLSIQSLSTFHIFYAWFMINSVTLMLLSLKTAGEKIRLKTRKMHYLLFLGFYGLFYSVCWAGAVRNKVKGVREW